MGGGYRNKATLDQAPDFLQVSLTGPKVKPCDTAYIAQLHPQGPGTMPVNQEADLLSKFPTGYEREEGWRHDLL